MVHRPARECLATSILGLILADAARNTVIMEQCLQIKRTACNAPGRHVTISRCCFEMDSADVIVGNCSFEADRAES